MADEFANMVDEAVGFLAELRDNNNRDWFQDNKARYAAAIKHPGSAFGDVIATALLDLTGAEHTTKLFRANRDVRFSKDKTPYNTHMHILWSSGPGVPGWFFGISPDYVTAGCGLMAFDKTQLMAYRARVDKNGDAIAKLCADLVAKGYRLDPPELKRVPPPYDKDHPHGALLRRKGLALWANVSGEGSPKKRVTDAFKDLLPIYELTKSLA